MKARESRFKVGDRVRVTTSDEDFYRSGDCGEVVGFDIDDTYDVMFDKDRDKHTDWCVGEEDLEPELASAPRAHSIRVQSAVLNTEIRMICDENDRLRAAIADVHAEGEAQLRAVWGSADPTAAYAHAWGLFRALAESMTEKKGTQ